jgi:eukaryotic-like serine/threonine-protein kinase
MTTDMGQIGPGQVIDGKYRIVRLLGTGGMGAVFEGENLRIRRRVAIKLLHEGVSDQVEVVRRFEREAQAAALVGSEHICEVLDLGVLPDNTRYMVMEYLDGETLGSRITRSGRLSPAQSTPLLLQVLEALGAAHAAGIIHRDLKPDNIFILPQRSGMRDFVKILDFGVSKFAHTAGEEMGVTRAGAIVGTPYYMSPEQARGSSVVDARSDVYAIGVLLYQATTGQVPFQAETFNELLFKIVLEVAPPPQTYAPDLDPDFAAIIQRAMARDPAQRFQNCAEFREAILGYQASRQGGYPPVPQPGGRVSLPMPPFDNQNQPRMPSGPSFPGGTTPSHLPSGPNWPGGATPSHLPSGPNWPGGATPSHPPSGPNWQSGPGTPVPGAITASGTPATTTATGNSWGNASNADAVPKSRAPLIIGGIAGSAVVIGLIVAAASLFGKDPSVKPGASAEVGTPATAPTTSVITPPPTATVAPVASVAPAETVAVPVTAAPAATLKPSSTPVAKGKGTPGNTAKAAAAKAGSTATPKQGGGTDLGY